MSAVSHIMDDDGFAPSQATDENGVGKAWRKELFTDMERGVGVMVWKADIGVYDNGTPPYAETFVVLDGTAEVSIGGAPFEEISRGSIVHMPLGAGMRMKVKTPYRMVATAVLDKPTD